MKTIDELNKALREASHHPKPTGRKPGAKPIKAKEEPWNTGADSDKTRLDHLHDKFKIHVHGAKTFKDDPDEHEWHDRKADKIADDIHHEKHVQKRMKKEPERGRDDHNDEWEDDPWNDYSKKKTNESFKDAKNSYVEIKKKAQDYYDLTIQNRKNKKLYNAYKAQSDQYHKYLQKQLDDIKNKYVVKEGDKDSEFSEDGRKLRELKVEVEHHKMMVDLSKKHNLPGRVDHHQIKLKDKELELQAHIKAMKIKYIREDFSDDKKKYDALKADIAHHKEKLGKSIKFEKDHPTLDASGFEKYHKQKLKEKEAELKDHLRSMNASHVKEDTENPGKKDHPKDPPPIILLKRKAIRVFPNGKRVAMYYAQSIDRYISIPYDDNKFNPPTKEKKDIPGIEEAAVKESNSLMEAVSKKKKKTKKKKKPAIAGTGGLSNLTKLGVIANEKNTGMLKFEDGSSSRIDAIGAKSILKVHRMASDEHKLRIERMVNKNKHNFSRMAAFAAGYHASHPDKDSPSKKKAKQ